MNDDEQEMLNAIACWAQSQGDPPWHPAHLAEPLTLEDRARIWAGIDEVRKSWALWAVAVIFARYEATLAAREPRSRAAWRRRLPAAVAALVVAQEGLVKDPPAEAVNPRVLERCRFCGQEGPACGFTGSDAPPCSISCPYPLGDCQQAAEIVHLTRALADVQAEIAALRRVGADA